MAANLLPNNLSTADIDPNYEDVTIFNEHFLLS